MGEREYTVEDIYLAFNMGLDSSVFALEKSLDWSIEEREYLIERLKRFTVCKKGMVLKDSKPR